jgi:hypothetical protein
MARALRGLACARSGRTAWKTRKEKNEEQKNENNYAMGSGDFRSRAGDTGLTLKRASSSKSEQVIRITVT